MEVARDSSVGETVADKYRVIRPLGEGGMGRVWLARHELTGRAVALKLVPVGDQPMRQRLLREAQSMGRLSHPNVVGVLDMGEWGGAVFIAMEYVHGENLRRFVRRCGPCDVEQAVRLLLPACSGVAAAHQAGILHRDLKPENLFVCTDSDGTPFDTKVLDFGVAKILDASDENISLTDRGSFVGTPKYMAPEQLAEDAELDERTDIYALALILYELIAGRLPYETSSLRAMVLRILTGQFPALHELEPSVPEALSDVVMEALALQANDRPRSVSEFAKSLEPFAGGLTFQPPREVHTPDPSVDSWPSPAELDELPLGEQATRPGKPLEGSQQSRESSGEAGALSSQRRLTVRRGAVGWLMLGTTLLVLGLGTWWWLRRPPVVQAPAPAAVDPPQPAPVAVERPVSPPLERQPVVVPEPDEPAAATTHEAQPEPAPSAHPSRRPRRRASKTEPAEPPQPTDSPPSWPPPSRTTDNRDPWAEQP